MIAAIHHLLDFTAVEHHLVSTIFNRDLMGSVQRQPIPSVPSSREITSHFVML